MSENKKYRVGLGVSGGIAAYKAIEVLRLINYQRLSIQIIGALNSPISKKKLPMSWLEIKNLIIELRTELGLPLEVTLVA